MTRSLRRIYALTVKELLAVLKDRRSRIVLVVPPLLQLMIFGYAATFDLNDIAVAIYDEDRGADARELVARIEGSPNFRLAGHILSDDALESLIDGRRVLAVIHIGRNFGARLARGDTAALQVLIDGRNSNTALLAQGYLRRIVADFNRERASRYGLAPPPVAVTTRAWFNTNMESRWFIVPGIVGLLTLVITTMVTALSVAREREAGTFDQLLMTPMRPIEILAGKSLPGILIGVFEGSFILLMAVYWFDVPLRGSLGALYLGMFLFSLSAVGIGLMISSLALTQQQGLLGAFLFVVPAVILSGFATPIANMPQPVQWITYLDPLRYFLIILRAVFLEGSSLNTLIPYYWPMAVIGIATLAAAGWLFRHRIG